MKFRFSGVVTSVHLYSTSLHLELKDKLKHKQIIESCLLSLLFPPAAFQFFRFLTRLLFSKDNLASIIRDVYLCICLK